MTTSPRTFGTPRIGRAGFTLVEVALALGVASFCMVALLGLIPAGLNSSQNAISQTGAVGVIRSIATDLKSARLSATESPEYALPLDGASSTELFVEEGGRFSRTLAQVPRARFRATVTTLEPSTADDAPSASLQRIVISWPAAAEPAEATGRLETIVALDRNS